MVVVRETEKYGTADTRHGGGDWLAGKRQKEIVYLHGYESGARHAANAADNHQVTHRS